VTSINRRTLIKLAGAAAIGAVAYPLVRNEFGTTAAPVVPGSLGSLNVGYLPITDSAPLLVAHANGDYTQNGFNVETPVQFPAWPALTEAFLAGQVDVVHLLMPLALNLKFGKNQDIKIVSWNHTNGSALTVSNEINSIADLAGKTIAIPLEFSLHNVVLQQVLRANNLVAIFDGDASVTESTVKLVNLPPAEMPAALAGKSISGFIVAEPFNALVETKGIGKILRFTGDVWKEHACCVTVVRGELVNDSPEIAQGLVNSVASAQLSISNDRNAAAKSLANGYLPQGEEAISRALTAYGSEYDAIIKNPDWNSERISFQPYAFPSYTEELVNQLKVTKFSQGADINWIKSLDPKSAHSQVVAEGLALTAIESLGGLGKFNLPSDLTRTEVISA
jgi:NitT/TauT family transport system substrate-binding protein